MQRCRKPQSQSTRSLPVIPKRPFLSQSLARLVMARHKHASAAKRDYGLCEAGGGEVIVPAGTFITGRLNLSATWPLVFGAGCHSARLGGFQPLQAGSLKPAWPTRAPAGPCCLHPRHKLTNICDFAARYHDGAGEPWWQRFRACAGCRVPQQGNQEPPSAAETHVQKWSLHRLL